MTAQEIHIFFEAELRRDIVVCVFDRPGSPLEAGSPEILTGGTVCIATDELALGVLVRFSARVGDSNVSVLYDDEAGTLNVRWGTCAAKE